MGPAITYWGWEGGWSAPRYWIQNEFVDGFRLTQIRVGGLSGPGINQGEEGEVVGLCGESH